MNENEKEQYSALISEVIAKQSVILGSEMAIFKAKKVAGLSIDDKGKVLEIKGNPQEKLKSLIDVYVELSGQIVKNALGSVFAKYPTLSIK